MYKKYLFWYFHTINQNDRECMHKHKGMVIWLTGLSGAGKSTISDYLEQALYNIGVNTYLLDGDNIRHGLNKDLNFNYKNRKENIRRIGELVKIMLDTGLFIITALISPNYKERNKIRKKLPKGNFLEIYVYTTKKKSKHRYNKNLYLVDNNNIIYEKPLYPEIYIKGNENLKQITIKILIYILLNKYK